MNNYYNKERTFKTINEIIENGLKLMNNNLTEEQFKIWLDYSKQMIELTTKGGNPTILLNYLRLTIDIYNENIPPQNKLNMCLKYLIEVLRIL